MRVQLNSSIINIFGHHKYQQSLNQSDHHHPVFGLLNHLLCFIFSALCFKKWGSNCIDIVIPSRGNKHGEWS